MDEFKQHLKKQGFELLNEIGKGLSGKTYSARQPSLNRQVAVKFFNSKLHSNNPDLKKRFKREAFLLAETQHPSIPYVITHGEITSQSTPYIVMQYIDGLNLDEYLKLKKTLDQHEVISIAIQVLDALTLIHSKKIIHRDIKPSNIMVSKFNHTYLIDFSIGYSQENKSDLTRATRTGDHLGSFEYMSPEQKINMKDIDNRSDIYSLGLTLCTLLTGKPHLKNLDKTDFSIPFQLKKCIFKACETEIKDRFDDVSQMHQELKNIIGANYYSNETPRLALCNNVKCKDAIWTPNGYYKGANFINNCTDIHCTSCGNKLIYQCNCGYPIANTQYCGGCGVELFQLPSCVACDSYLTKPDMDKDTTNGCSKCLKPQVMPQQQQPYKNTDDDIPF